MCNTTPTSGTSSSSGTTGSGVSTVGATAPTAPSAPTEPKLGFATQAVRKKEDIAITKAQFPKSYRLTVTAEERMKISKAACTGASLKLEKVDYSKMSKDTFNDDQFDKIVEMQTFLSQTKQHFIKYDMCYLFRNFPVLEDSVSGDPNNKSDRFRSGHTVDLFEVWSRIGTGKEIPVQRIADVVGWIQEYATEDSAPFLEDMEWTHAYLLGSMSNDLAVSVQRCLDEDYREYQQGGPLTFAVMLEKAVNLTHSKITSMQTSIRNYCISNVPGENIELVGTRFLYVFQSLEHNNSLSADLVQALFKVFQTTSVSDFNSMISQWRNTILMGTASMPTYQEIIQKAQSFYHSLNGLGDWTASDNQGSVFKADSAGSRSGDRESDRPLSPWLEPPTPQMKVCDNPLRYEKTLGGGKVFWCSKCGRGKRQGKWTKSHYTDTHLGRNPHANVVNTEGDKAKAKSQTDGNVSKKVSFAESLQDAAGSREQTGSP